MDNDTSTKQQLLDQLITASNLEETKLVEEKLRVLYAATPLLWVGTPPTSEV